MKLPTTPRPSPDARVGLSVDAIIGIHASHRASCSAAAAGSTAAPSHSDHIAPSTPPSEDIEPSTMMGSEPGPFPMRVRLEVRAKAYRQIPPPELPLRRVPNVQTRKGQICFRIYPKPNLQVFASLIQTEPQPLREGTLLR